MEDTNKKQIAEERFRDAQKAVKSLIGLAHAADDELSKVINHPDGMGVSIGWITNLSEKVEIALCEVSRGNGVLLARHVPEKKKERGRNESLVDRHMMP